VALSRPALRRADKFALAETFPARISAVAAIFGGETLPLRAARSFTSRIVLMASLRPSCRCSAIRRRMLVHGVGSFRIYAIARRAVARHDQLPQGFAGNATLARCRSDKSGSRFHAHNMVACEADMADPGKFTATRSVAINT
jgi:hypothetical protein